MLAAASSSSSCPLLTKPTTFHSPPRKFHKLLIQFKPIFVIPLKLNTRFRPTNSRFAAAAAAFDAVQTTHEEWSSDGEEVVDEYSEEEGTVEEEEETVAEEEKDTVSVESGRLYVGNLPYSTTKTELWNVFGEAGDVVAVEIVYDRVTDRSRGFAFVTMASAQQAMEAIRMFDGSQIGGRTVKVNFPEVPKGGEREVMGPKIRSNYQGFVDSPYKIYAGNLSWVITSEALREAFSEQPGLLGTKVIYERDSGRSRGYGFVTFRSAEEAESALNALNGLDVEGRPLRLNLANKRTTSNPPSRLEIDSGSSLESDIFSFEH